LPISKIGFFAGFLRILDVVCSSLRFIDKSCLDVGLRNEPFW